MGASEGRGVGTNVGCRDGSGVGTELGKLVGIGVIVGRGVGSAVGPGELVGTGVGSRSLVGSGVGSNEGAMLGKAVGAIDGKEVGINDGTRDGENDGANEGSFVGESVGTKVGSALGNLDGAGEGASEYVRWQLTMQKSSPTDGSGVGIDDGGFVYSTTTVDTPTLVSASVVSTLIAWLSKRDALFSDASSLSMLLKFPFETADVRSDVKDAASADVDPLKL